MEYRKVLDNKIKITSRLNQGYYTETTAGFTLRFVFGGHEMCTLGRRRLSIQNDSFIALNKGTRFTGEIGTADPVNVFTIEFDDSFLAGINKACLRKYNVDSGSDDTDYLQNDLVETIYPFRGEMKLMVMELKEYLDGDDIDESKLDEYLRRCLLCYYQVYDEEILQKATKLNFLHFSTRIEILRRLNLAKEYLYANYSHNVNLENLADHSCLSVNHLLRTFKLAYNQSPHQFLIQLRLQRARLLLTKTEYPVYEIVNMVGFKCTSSFIRLFRNRYKTTPLKYRNVLAA